MKYLFIVSAICFLSLVGCKNGGDSSSPAVVPPKAKDNKVLVALLAGTECSECSEQEMSDLVKDTVITADEKEAFSIYDSIEVIQAFAEESLYGSLDGNYSSQILLFHLNLLSQKVSQFCISDESGVRGLDDPYASLKKVKNVYQYADYPFSHNVKIALQYAIDYQSEKRTRDDVLAKFRELEEIPPIGFDSLIEANVEFPNLYQKVLNFEAELGNTSHKDKPFHEKLSPLMLIQTIENDVFEFKNQIDERYVYRVEESIKKNSLLDLDIGLTFWSHNLFHLLEKQPNSEFFVEKVLNQLDGQFAPNQKCFSENCILTKNKINKELKKCLIK